MSASLDAMAELTFLSGLMRRLRYRKLLITCLTILLFTISGLAIAVLPRSYEGITSVAIEGQTPTAVQNGDVLHDMPFDDQTIGTELAILQSRELFADTINQVGLLSKAEFNPSLRRPGLVGQALMNLRGKLDSWIPDDSGIVVTASEQATADTLATLRKHVKLAPVARSRVIEITVTANNNKLAAQIANKMADLYILNHREYRQAAIREAHQFLDARISELRKEAADKTAAAEDYRISHGLTVAMTATLIQEQVSGLSTQLQLARAKLAELEGHATSARGADPATMTQVLASQTMTNLRTQEATLASEQARLSQTYGVNHPMLGRVNAQLASVRAQIGSEAARFGQSVPNDVTAARANVNSLTQRLDDLKAQASQTEQARTHLATLEDDATTARRLYNDFLTRLRETDATMAYLATNVRVISYSVVPIRPAWPNYLLMVPTAFIASLLLAGGVAYRTTAPRGMVGRDDVESLFAGVRALGMIPLRTPRTLPQFETAIEQLLNSLIMKDEHPPRSILITSAFPQEGKTTTARALAAAAQRRGIRVFLVDADMRSAMVAHPKTSAPMVGLGDVLRGHADWRDVTRKCGGNVPMLPAGTPKGNPTSLMALPSLKLTLNQLAVEHDLVIVDAPPILVGGDCEMLAMAVDKTVLLAKWHATQPEIVAVALEQLDKKKIAGMVLTMVDTGKIGRYGQSDAVIYSRPLHQYYRQ